MNEITKDLKENSVSDGFSFAKLMENFEYIRDKDYADASEEFRSALNSKDFNDLTKKLPKRLLNKTNFLEQDRNATYVRPKFEVVKDNRNERVVKYSDGQERTYYKGSPIKKDVEIESYLLKELSAGKELKDIKSPYGDEDGSWFSPFILANVMRVIAASKFVEDYKNTKVDFIVNERLRDGFIGKEKVIAGQKVLQTERGYPVGTIVALPHGKDVVVGISLVDHHDKEKQRPILGLALALKDADDVKNRWNELGAVSCLGEYPQFSFNDKIPRKHYAQIKHFIRRARAFYFPELYSYNRGSVRPTAEEHETWKKNRKNREAVLNRLKEV